MLNHLLVLVLAAPQAPSQCSVERMVVPGARHELFAVSWPSGLEQDPAGQSGLAKVRADLAVQAAAPLLPSGVVAGVEVLASATLFFATVPLAQCEAGCRWAFALVGPQQLPADGLALLQARAALAADDAEYLYPGPMLRSRLRRTLLPGLPGARCELGDPVELQGLPADWSCGGPPQGCRLLCLGGADLEQLARIEAAVRRPDGCGPLPPAPVVRTPPPPGPPFTPHPRVDAAFVSAGLPAPAPTAPDAEAFAVAVEVLRLAAAQSFAASAPAPAGREDPRAGAVHFDWLGGERLVVLTRRGPDHVGKERPQAELQELLARLPRFATPARLAAARDGLRRELGQLPVLPPELPPAWRPRARAWLLAAHLGLDPLRLQLAAATDAAVGGQLSALSRFADWTCVGLLPVPRPWQPK